MPAKGADMATESRQPGHGQRPEHRTDESGPSERRHPSHAPYRHYSRRMKTRSFDARTIAEGIGWFSVALGTAALLAPRSIGTLSGAGRSRPRLMQGIGA